MSKGRIIIFTGKGGVGKTSLSSAHALLSSEEKIKSLIVSTDLAHSLGDIFDTPINNEPTKINEYLTAIELDPYEIMKNDFPKLYEKLTISKYSRELDDITRLIVIPGFENLFSLLKLKKLYELHEYERIFVDCPQIGESLSILKLPELLSWYMENFFKVGKGIIRILNPISDKIYRVSLPKNKELDEFEAFYYELISLNELLKNNSITSIRLVTLPEKMVVNETKRSLTYLELYGYTVDMAFINRRLPKIEDDFLKEIIKTQEESMIELNATLWSMEVEYIKWFPNEIHGIEGIRLIAEELKKFTNIFKVHNKDGEKLTYEKLNDGYLLKLKVRTSKTNRPSVIIKDKDVHIALNNYRRLIGLPDVVSTYKSYDIKWSDEELLIYFHIGGTL